MRSHKGRAFRCTRKDVLDIIIIIMFIMIGRRIVVVIKNLQIAQTVVIGMLLLMIMMRIQHVYSGRNAAVLSRHCR